MNPTYIIICLPFGQKGGWYIWLKYDEINIDYYTSVRKSNKPVLEKALWHVTMLDASHGSNIKTSKWPKKTTASACQSHRSYYHSTESWRNPRNPANPPHPFRQKNRATVPSEHFWGFRALNDDKTLLARIAGKDQPCGFGLQFFSFSWWLWILDRFMFRNTSVANENLCVYKYCTM